MLIKTTVKKNCFPGEVTRSHLGSITCFKYLEEATGFQAGLKKKSKVVIADGEPHERGSVPMRQEKKNICHSKSAGVFQFAGFPHPVVPGRPKQ